jgi:hypothetical protein
MKYKVILTGTQNSGAHVQVFVSDEMGMLWKRLANCKALSQNFLEGTEKNHEILM